MPRKRILLIWLLVVVITATGVSIGRLSATMTGTADEGYKELKTFTEVLSMVKKYYVEDVSTKNLVYAAIKGMLGSLDPHSSFMPPEAFKEMQVETKGEFGGLGIQIGMKDGVLTVIAPIEDTPAWKAGIKAGDQIVKISGKTTKDMTLEDAVMKMRGAPKTPITITISREGWKEPKDFTIVREIIKIKSVKSKIIDGDIGYVKISQFQEQTASDLEKALKKFDEKKVNSIIIDLRNNPGGLLDSAVDVAGELLPKSKLVVYTKTRSGEKTNFYTDGNQLAKQPMIVLVNGGSASASEIVAGALKDWNRAVILGTQTFGKGSVQTVIPLSDGSGLRLTTARYYTPNGISIQNTGITPDIVVKIEPKNGGKEHPMIREVDLAGHLKNDQIRKTKPEEVETIPYALAEKEDVQLQRAVDILKTWNVFKGLPGAAHEGAAKK